MKKLIIIFAALFLLLGGAGAAAYLGYLPLGFLGGEQVAAPETEMIEMGAFNLSVIRGGALKGRVTITISLEVKSGTDKFRVWRMQPVLRDAFIADLHAMLPLKIDDPGFIHGDFMRARLQAIADKRIGRGYVRKLRIYTVRKAS